MIFFAWGGVVIEFYYRTSVQFIADLYEIRSLGISDLDGSSYSIYTLPSPPKHMMETNVINHLQHIYVGYVQPTLHNDLHSDLPKAAGAMHIDRFEFVSPVFPTLP